MKKKQMRLIADYLAWAQPLMGLDQWSLRVNSEPSADDDDSLAASVEPVEGRYLAVVKCGLGFWDDSWENQRHYLKHELVHLHHRDSSEVWRTFNRAAMLPQTTYDALWESHRLLTELMTDQLAYAFDGLMDDSHFKDRFDAMSGRNTTDE